MLEQVFPPQSVEKTILEQYAHTGGRGGLHTTACEYFLKGLQLCGHSKVEESEKVVRKKPQTGTVKG